MRVVMTGGGGFIGSHLLARMIGAGMDVTLIGPNMGKSRYTASLVSAGLVRFFRCDGGFSEDDVLRPMLEEADALVMLGYVMPAPSSVARRLLEEFACNVTPTMRLLRTAIGNVRHVVFASSMSVYGAPCQAPLRESDAPAPQTPYAVAKLACEHAIKALCASAGVGLCTLRYSTVYGPGETTSRAIPNFIRAALAGRPPLVNGTGLDEHDYVHVADVVDATLAALRPEASGVYNIGTGIGTKTIDLARLVVDLAAASVTPLCGRPPAAEQVPVRMVCDTTLARTGLGFAARRVLADGLPEEIGWFRAQRGAPGPLAVVPTAPAALSVAPA